MRGPTCFFDWLWHPEWSLQWRDSFETILCLPQPPLILLPPTLTPPQTIPALLPFFFFFLGTAQCPKKQQPPPGPPHQKLILVTTRPTTHSQLLTSGYFHHPFLRHLCWLIGFDREEKGCKVKFRTLNPKKKSLLSPTYVLQPVTL